MGVYGLRKKLVYNVMRGAKSRNIKARNLRRSPVKFSIMSFNTALIQTSESIKKTQITQPLTTTAHAGAQRKQRLSGKGM